MQDTYAANSKQVDIVTAGCTYRDGTSLTVHGKVTDFQMWGKALSDEQLVKVDTSGQGGDSLSAAQLMRNVQEIRQEFTSLVQEVEDLKVEQQSAMTNILGELKTVMETAEQLQGKLNLPKED